METIADFEAAGTLWIYDASTDSVRAATQLDISKLMRAALHGADIRQKAIEYHEAWLKEFGPDATKSTP